MTISTNAPQSSETTGPASLGSAASNAIGQLRSGTALANSAPAAALAKLTPQETNARMEACLERISGRRPVLARRMLFPSDGPAYSITEAASWKCATESQRNEALAAVEFALRPASEEDIGAALYTLRIMTRGRDQRTDADREAEAMIWLAHLQQFPADIVLTTLRNCPKRPDGQWWPTWHDVQRELDAMTSGRRLLADHIRSSKCLPAPATDDDAPRTEEQQARIDGIVAKARERFGIKTHQGETVVDRDAIPEAKRAELDRAVQAVADRIKAEGLPKLSPRIAEDVRRKLEAAQRGAAELAEIERAAEERRLKMAGSTAVPSPADQFDEWDRSTTIRNEERAA